MSCEDYFTQTLQDNLLFPLRQVKEKESASNLETSPFESESRADVISVFLKGKNSTETDIQSYSIVQSWHLSIESIRGRVAAKSMLAQLILSSFADRGFDLDSFRLLLGRMPPSNHVVRPKRLTLIIRKCSRFYSCIPLISTMTIPLTKTTISIESLMHQIPRIPHSRFLS